MQQNMNRYNKILINAVEVLAILEFVLIILSWIICTAFPESPFRTLLCSEGIRWFFGNFISNLRTDILVWILLLLMACGCLERSRIYLCIIDLMEHRQLEYRKRIGLVMVLIEMIAFLIVMLLLTVVPQAILLSVSGDLFPSAFSKSIVACLSFLIILSTASYGLIVHSMKNIKDVLYSFEYGIKKYSKVLVVYVFVVQFICSLKYVLIQT